MIVIYKVISYDQHVQERSTRYTRAVVIVTLGAGGAPSAEIPPRTRTGRSSGTRSGRLDARGAPGVRTVLAAAANPLWASHPT